MIAAARKAKAVDKAAMLLVARGRSRGKPVKKSETAPTAKVKKTEAAKEPNEPNEPVAEAA